MTYTYFRYLKIAVVVGVGLMLGVALWDALVRSSSVVTVLLFSVFTAAAYEPGVNRYTAGGKRSRGRAALFLLGVTLSLVSLLAFIFGAMLHAQWGDLTDAIPGLVTNIESTLNKNFGVNLDLSRYTDSFKTKELEGRLLSYGGSAIGFIGSLLAVLFVSYYLIVDGPRIRQRICTLLPAHAQKEVLRMWEITVDKTGNYIFSRFILGVLVFIGHGAAFYAMGVPYAIPFAIWAALVGQLIPILGTYLAAALPLAVIWGQGNGILALGMLLFVVLYQQIENLVISPKLLKKTMDLNPIVAFTGVLVAASTLNFVYVLLALPIIATLQAFATAYVQTHDLDQGDDPAS